MPTEISEVSHTSTVSGVSKFMWSAIGVFRVGAKR